MRSITRRFGDVVACDRVDLEVASGSVHALLGENGAGKTTLCRILFGEIQPDTGTTEILGKSVDIRSPADALALGVGMVHQRFQLCEQASALDNCILGSEPRRGGFVDRRQARRRLEELARGIGFAIDFRSPARVRPFISSPCCIATRESLSLTSPRAC